MEDHAPSFARTLPVKTRYLRNDHRDSAMSSVFSRFQAILWSS